MCSRIIASKRRFFKCLTKAYRDSAHTTSVCLCLIATRDAIWYTYIYNFEHNQVRIPDAIGSETRHAAPYCVQSAPQ